MPPRPPSSALELQVLGVPVATLHAETAPWRLKRAFALLAYLAFVAAPVPRVHLTDLLWPDADEAQGRARLRRLIYTIDESVGATVFVALGDSLALREGAVEVDALKFARFGRRVVAAGLDDAGELAEAQGWIARAHRPLLQDIAFGSEHFDDWVKATSLEHEHLLARVLERLVEALGRQGRFGEALELAERLIGLDPYREPSHVLVMQLHALQGHSAGVEASYMRCAELLRAEFGIPPGPQTERAYLRMTEDLRRLSSRRVDRPQLRFAEDGSGAVAYTRLGAGARTLILSAGFVGHIEIALEFPPFRAVIDALANHFQVILFDRRGVGLSERLRARSTPAAIADDIGAILSHANVERAWLFGWSEGGLGAMQFAIDHPDRVEGLCLFGALACGSAAPDYPWALPTPAYDAWLRQLIAGWGGPIGLDTFAPGSSHDAALRAWWARLVRHGASPGGLEAILVGLRDADLRQDLGRIRAPTLVMHRRGDRAVRFAAGEHLARSIPGARWQPLEGVDHFWWCGDSGSVHNAILQFAGG